MATTAKQLTQALNGETTIELAYPVRLATGQLLEKVTVRRARVGDLRAVAHIGLPCGFICFDAGYILRQLGQPCFAGRGNAFSLRIGRAAHPAQLFRLPCVRHRPRAA